MIYKKIVLIFMVLSSMAWAQIQFGDSIMPFGVYSPKSAGNSFFTDSLLELMHTTLGFNQHMSVGFTVANTYKFNNKGMYPYPANTGSNDPQRKYGEVIYFICQPESSSYYNLTFDNMSDWEAESSWVYSDDGMISNLAFIHRNKYYNLDNKAQIEYYPSLRIRIDTAGFSGDTLVGVFKARRAYPSAEDLFVDSLWYSDFRDEQDSIFADFIELNLKGDFIFDSTYYALDTLYDSTYFYIRHHSVSKSAWITYSFEADSNCTVYLDYFKVHCQNGADLVEELDPDIRSAIITSISREAYKDSILGWFILDTMNPGADRPFAYINRLIEDSSGWGESSVYAVGWVIPGGIYGSPINHDGGTYRDFVRIVRPKLLWSYLYPISLYTDYTGYLENGLQLAFKKYITDPCDSIGAVLNDFSETEGWLYTPQFWYCDPRTTNCRFGETRRKPTRSELRCMTFLGMCYHPKSILLWKFDASTDSCNYGILDENGDPREGMYDAVKDDINPYIKAIDEYYMPLTWDAAYAVNPDSAFPGSDMINDIQAVSNLPDTNPDLGWFHVGEYYDDASARYFMLVNRACNIDSTTLAPDVTAIVELNRSQFEDAEQLLVIDIAYEVDTNWAAIPETTYTSLLPDNKLLYNTVLKAGEGRLFKVVRTDNE